MTTESHILRIAGLSVEVVRKPIKNLHLGVYPPEGRVRVATPLAVDDDAVRMAVINRLGWIKRQRMRFQEQPRQSQRLMVSGESHYFLGQRYRLRVISHDGAARISLHGKSVLELRARPNCSVEKREEALQAFYRAELKQRVPELMKKWQPILGVEATAWGIKRMKTKWGTCNPTARRIWLNLELAKKPVQCLEYILVHELTHLIERTHNERFLTVLDRHLPHWQVVRDELNSSMLAEERWN